MEDSDVVSDLCCHNGIERSKFAVFWDHCVRFHEDIAVAVHDRRHGQITHYFSQSDIGNYLSCIIWYNRFSYGVAM